MADSKADIRKVKVRNLDDRTDFLEKHSKTIALLEEQIENLKKREIALNRLTASLEKRNLRLEELNQIKDEFIGIASHQLRTPATGVKQYIDLLLDGFAEEVTQSQRVFLERAQESNDRQLRIIDDLLQVARIDSETFELHKSKVDVGRLVGTSIEELKAKMNKHDNVIRLTKPKRKIEVQADEERLRMVIQNILDNAINYSPEHKTVEVSVQRKDGKLVIAVADHGVGIGREDYPKLFQKFSRIPNPLSVEVGGTGLGLYWAAKVVHLHGGKIEVRSRLGKGSIFSIVLPAR